MVVSRDERRPCGYVPVGSEPYVLGQERLGNLGPILMLAAIAGLWALGVISTWVAWFLLCIAGTIFAFGLSDRRRRGDDLDIQFAVDESGIYFGDWPREHIPWARVAEVALWETNEPEAGEPQPEHPSVADQCHRRDQQDWRHGPV